MSTCDRCGENNSDDAAFCGRCGAAITQAGSVASLVDDSPDAAASALATAPGDRPRSSEWVAPPAYGETAAATPIAGAGAATTDSDQEVGGAASAPTTVTPIVAADQPQPFGSDPLVMSGAAGGSSRTGQIVAATLAVLFVLIIGAVVLLVSARGSGGEFARTGADPTSPVEEEPNAAPATDGPVVTTAPEPVSTPAAIESTIATAPLDRPAVDPTPSTVPAAPTSSTTVPATTVATSTTPPSTAPPSTVPPTTAAPTTAPPTTVAPAPTVPRRGADDLALTRPILVAPCTGGYVTFVRSVVGRDRATGERVEVGLADFPDSEYLSGGICPSIRTRTDAGDQIYGIVYGPFDTAGEACQVARDYASAGAYVRRLTDSESDIGNAICVG